MRWRFRHRAPNAAVGVVPTPPKTAAGRGPKSRDGKSSSKAPAWKRFQAQTIMAMPENPGPLVERAGRRVRERTFESRFAPEAARRHVIVFCSKTKDLPQEDRRLKQCLGRLLPPHIPLRQLQPRLSAEPAGTPSSAHFAPTVSGW